LKLQTKILLLLTPLVLAPIIGVGTSAYLELREGSMSGAHAEMDKALDQLDSQLAHIVHTAEANVDLFAQSELLQKYVVTDDESQRFILMQPALLRQFASYQRAYPEYFEIRVLMPDGFEDTRRVSGRIRNRTEDEADTPYFRAMTQHPEAIFSRVISHPDTGRCALLVSTALDLLDWAVDPIIAQSKLRGYLAVTVALDDLKEKTAAMRLGEQGSTFWVTKLGRVLFDGKLFEENEFLEPALLNTLQAIAISGAPRTVEIAGESYLVRGLSSADNLYLFATYSEDELFARTQTLASQIALVTVIVSVLAAGLLFAVMRYVLVRPLSRLTEAAREIGGGNLEPEIQISSRDEIGMLAGTFREMGRHLSDYRDQITHLAYHDNLTGLPNRLMFREYLIHALANARRHKERLALLFLDIDNFKQINDSLGHDTGDELLRMFAERLGTFLREEDFVSRSNIARLGGDEFLILLSGFDNPHAAGAVARRVIDPFDEPVQLGAHEFHITVSVGITIAPDDGDDVDTLIKNADTAMYHAKRQGKNGYQYFAQEMNIEAVERVSLEADLRRALERDELSLVYQPQVDVHTGEIVGLEALLRWEQPRLGAIPPERFIPVAEETGLILPIGEWVLNKASRQAQSWQARGLKPVTIAVNLSSVQLARQDVAGIVRRCLRSTALDPRWLQIELTETSVLQTSDQATATLEAIKALGVKVSLDDFGSGYSSLGYLRQLDLDALKMDRSFVQGLTDEPDDAAIVRAIVALARSLNLTVMAEGVETLEQLGILCEAGCNYAQGFLIAHPMSALDVEDVLKPDSVIEIGVHSA
jgi:diguanylate cyclase (GGDEF)-like protein